MSLATDLEVLSETIDNLSGGDDLKAIKMLVVAIGGKMVAIGESSFDVTFGDVVISVEAKEKQ